MTYTVKYKKVGSWFWHTLKNVEGDLTMHEVGMPVRVFTLADKSRIEIPALTHVFEFSKERFAMILANAEKQVGQKIPTN